MEEMELSRLTAYAKAFTGLTPEKEALLIEAGPEAVVTVLAKPKSKLGFIFLDVKRAAESIEKLI